MTTATDLSKARLHNVQTIMALLLGSVAFTVLLCLLTRLILNVCYTNEDAVYARERQKALDLEYFLQEEQISSDDLSSVGIWSQQNRFYEIIIMQNHQILYSSDSKNSGQDPNAATEEKLSDMTCFDLTLTDGEFKLYLIDHSTQRISFVCIIGSILSGLIFALILSLVFTIRKFHRVSSLITELEELKQGRLQEPLLLKGKDELSLLSNQLEDLRLALQKQKSDEKDAWDQNYELLTAVSHDIRTPLTALLGYLSLMKEIPEGAEEYLQPAYQKALQLKKLTDDLFRYFMVYGKKDLVLEFEDFPVSVVLGEMLGERIADLIGSGYQFQLLGLDNQQGVLSVDCNYLFRVFDNLFSNFTKYADPSQAITIVAHENDQKLHLIFDNQIRTNASHIESTGIGVKSSEKMMELLGGSIITSCQENHYQTELIFKISEQ